MNLHQLLTLTGLLCILCAWNLPAQEIIEFNDEAENLGPNVNSPYGELGPIISPDGRTLYICRDGHPQNMGGMGNQDIWTSTLLTNGTWSKAVPMHSPINTDGHNWISAVSSDGNTMLLGKKYNYYDGSTSNGVSLSFKDNRGWKYPKSQVITKYENKNKNVNFFMSGDAKVLLMAIEAKKGQGDLDIWVSFPEEGASNTWTKPINIGTTINTTGSESAPFLASDGKTLYFSSDGHSGGFGDSDIWVTKRLDDTWTNWSTPKNMGNKINSKGWDSYFSIPASGEYAYFVSSVSGQGKEDVFRIKMPVEAKPDPVVLVYGNVLDKKTNAVVEGNLQIEDLENGKIVGNTSILQEGKYSIVLLKGRKYGVHVQAKGYYSISEYLDLVLLDKYNEFKKDILMAPVVKDEVVRLNNLFFDQGKSTLKPESDLELNRLVELLTKNASLTIEISGHTDHVGSDEDNLKLSQDRAQSVVDYLVKNGIQKTRLTAKGYGEAAPVSTNDTDEGKALNRRVEFKVL